MLCLVVEKLSKLGDSDHPMIMLTVIGSTVSNTSYEEVPDWRKADLQSLRKELANVDWSACLDNLDTLQTWDFIKEKIKSAEAHSVPMKRRRVASKPLWMQQNILRIIRKKKRLWNTYQKSKMYEEYLAYKCVEKEVKSLVRRAKKKFEKKQKKKRRILNSFMHT